MAHARWLLAGLFLLAGTAESRAQVIIYYPSVYDYGSVSYNGGLGFKFKKRHLTASGFLRSSSTVGGFGPGWFGPGFYPAFAVPVQTVNVIVQPPPTVIVNPGRGDKVEDETAGIDLDEIDPVTMKHRKPEREKIDLAKRPPPRPPVEPPPPPRQPPPPPPQPRPAPPAEEEPKDELAFLLFRGKKEFAAKNHGLAAQRFQQATKVAPRVPRPYFLLAQAQLALGKYRLAVESIHAGMDRNKDWPTAKFPPRELYQANGNDFLAHLERLEEVVDKQPRDAALLFLLAYEWWFDGKRAKARPMFQKARKVAADPSYIDRFLKVD